MNKKNITLVAVLLLQLAVIAYLYWPVQPESGPSAPFFAGVVLSDITAVTINDADDKTIKMQRTEKGWIISGAGFPANTDAIKMVLGKIIGLSSERLISRTKSSRLRLEVAEQSHNRRVDLQLTDGLTKTFYLGSSPSQKNSYFREADSDLVYLVKGLSSWELQSDAESWWQTAYIDTADAELSAIKINNPLGEFSLVTGNDKKWQLTGGEPGVAGDISKFVQSLSKISLASYLPAKRPEGLEKAIATISYEGSNGTELLEIFNDSTGDDEYIVKSSEQVFYAKVRAYVLEEAIKASREGFLATPGKAVSD